MLNICLVNYKFVQVIPSILVLLRDLEDGATERPHSTLLLSQADIYDL